MRMNKSVIILLLAVLAPSLVLGWLAVRSASEQQIVLERRTAELYQKETDNAAAAARGVVSEQGRRFAETLRQMLSAESASSLATHFTEALRTRGGGQPGAGFALDERGRLVSPTAAEARGNERARAILYDHGAFLGGKAAAAAYLVTMDELSRPETNLRKSAPELMSKKAASKDAPEAPQMRNVAPSKQNAPLESQLVGATAEFRQFTSDGGEGLVNRFVQDRLNLILWVRPTVARDFVFGCVLRGDDLQSEWGAIFKEASYDLSSGRGEPEFVLALLDDKGKPATISPASATGLDWKKPFVATEIGEALPHWETALYLRHPGQLEASASRARRNLYLLIGCALAAIGVGGWAVQADSRRQLALAQKKTDFVSNVSHELKTPLTSIRMFAELLHDGRAAPERRGEYLRIMMTEAERLTRLINNVLDFARLERRNQPLQKRALDLHAAIVRVWDTQAPALRESGFDATWDAAPPPYPVLGDEDAIAQALVNLLSNAEKYGGEAKQIRLRTTIEDGFVCIRVLDRGLGVPAGEQRRIFEAFHRAHDSLSSGIGGAGLGLALVHRIAQEHGGAVSYAPREGGGSEFTLRIPIYAA